MWQPEMMLLCVRVCVYFFVVEVSVPISEYHRLNLVGPMPDREQYFSCATSFDVIARRMNLIATDASEIWIRIRLISRPTATFSTA